MGGFSGCGGFNQAFYPGFNSFNTSNGQGYNAYTMMGTGKHLDWSQWAVWAS